MKQQAGLATEWERQLTTAHANQTIGLTNDRAANCAPEVTFSPLGARSSPQLTFPFGCLINSYCATSAEAKVSALINLFIFTKCSGEN